MGVEREQRRRFGGQGIAERQQRDVFEDVGVVAGMEGVAVVHGDRVARWACWWLADAIGRQVYA